MKLSYLYYTILEKPFFIDLRRVDSRAVLIDRLLSHDTDIDGRRLSQREPLAHCVATPIPGGTLVGPAASASDPTATATATLGNFDEAPEGSVAVIPLKGDMLKQGTWCSYGTEELASLLMEAVRSKKIIGTVLDVDSGGGSVDAIAPLLTAIGESRAAGKPVVAGCDLCASAAYWVACHTNRVVAVNDLSAEFGSIGVMMQFADYQKYYEERGIKVHTIYSDLSGYKNAPFEAALKGDYKAIKDEVLNPLARQFQQAVRSQRPALDEKTEGVLNGRMFFARDALKVGLIDRVGNGLQTAIDEVVSLSYN